MTARVSTNDDFEDLSWHDCALYGLFIDTDGATTSELVLDIDFIMEWICGFGAWGFTQTLRHDPVETGDLQQLDPGRRPSMIAT